jgi:hypothetical protein
MKWSLRPFLSIDLQMLTLDVKDTLVCRTIARTDTKFRLFISLPSRRQINERHAYICLLSWTQIKGIVDWNIPQYPTYKIRTQPFVMLASFWQGSGQVWNFGSKSVLDFRVLLDWPNATFSRMRLAENLNWPLARLAEWNNWPKNIITSKNEFNNF